MQVADLEQLLEQSPKQFQRANREPKYVDFARRMAATGHEPTVVAAVTATEPGQLGIKPGIDCPR